MKPWKANKPNSKKDIEVELFLPDVRPKDKKKDSVIDVVNPNDDIKVEIFVSGKPFVSQKPKDNPSTKALEKNEN